MIVQPTWLLKLSWATLILGLVSAAFIVVDERVRGYRQPAKIMELVWPVTALYFGPGAAMLYRKVGRPMSPQWRDRYGSPPKRPRQAAVLIGLMHCSAHCTLGAIIATPIIFAAGFNISGDTLWPEYIGDYLAAVGVGIAFRYSAESRRGGLRVWAAMTTVVRADLLSVSVFELALFVWLGLLAYFVSPAALRPNDPVFWFIVQIGLVIGFFAAWPITSWLVRRGVKTEPPGAPQ